MCHMCDKYFKKMSGFDDGTVRSVLGQNEHKHSSICDVSVSLLRQCTGINMIKNAKRAFMLSNKGISRYIPMTTNGDL